MKKPYHVVNEKELIMDINEVHRIAFFITKGASNY
jgi:thiosulfate/3-mercaptopyruvate sulfurtransferase